MQHNPIFNVKYLYFPPIHQKYTSGINPNNAALNTDVYTKFSPTYL